MNSEDVGARLKAYQAEIKQDMVIDYVSLDDAALETPKLFGKWMEHLTNEIVRLSEVESQYKKVFKTRWAFYMGLASEDEYKKEPLRVKINKLEVNKYLDADDVLSEMSLRLDKQKAVVKMLEETIKTIRNRQFSIRDAIDWRKFQSGS